MGNKGTEDIEKKIQETLKNLNNVHKEMEQMSNDFFKEASNELGDFGSLQQSISELKKIVPKPTDDNATTTTDDNDVTTTTTAADTMNPKHGNEDGFGSTCGDTYTFNDTTITYKKDITKDEVTLDIAGPDGNTKIVQPLNDFRF